MGGHVLLSGGQSGASVELRAVNDYLVVYKSAPTELLAKRLYRQYLKHQDAIEFYKDLSISVPRISEPWDGSGYGMNYVRGTDAGFFIGLASRSSRIGFTYQLCEFLESSAKNSRYFSDEPNVQLQAKLHSMFQREESQNQRAFALSNQFLRAAIKWVDNNQIIQGWNHGDFSLDNLIVTRTGSKIWAIDFLDSPVDSPLIDYGRILLDLEFGWWRTFGSLDSRELTARRAIAREIRKSAFRIGLDSQALNIFTGFAAARVLPYTINPHRKAVLVNALSKAVEASAHEGGN